MVTSMKCEAWKIDVLRSLHLTNVEMFNKGFEDTFKQSVMNGLVSCELIQKGMDDLREDIAEKQEYYNILEAALTGKKALDDKQDTCKKVIEQVCLDWFGEDLELHLNRMLGDNRVEQYENYAATATERTGIPITFSDLLTTTRELFYKSKTQAGTA